MPLPEFRQLVDEAKSQISQITPEELRRMRQLGQDFTLIDVRERDGQGRHLRSCQAATWHPRSEHRSDYDRQGPQAGVVLRGGSRSALAAVNLKKMGFRNVFMLAGGYRDWREGDTL